MCPFTSYATFPSIKSSCTPCAVMALLLEWCMEQWRMYDPLIRPLRWKWIAYRPSLNAWPPNRTSVCSILYTGVCVTMYYIGWGQFVPVFAHLMGVGWGPIRCIIICEPYWSAPSSSNPPEFSLEPCTTTLWLSSPTSALWIMWSHEMMLYWVNNESLAGLKFGRLPFEVGWQNKLWQINCTVNNEQYKSS